MTAISNRLADTTVAVTGAAQGIGAAVAAAAAAAGARVVLMDRDAERLERLAAVLGDTHLRAIIDVTSESSLSDAFGSLRSDGVALGALVTCAGVELVGQDAPIHLLDLEVWQRTLAVNLTGTFLTCKHAVPLMLDGGGGAIVTVGSPAAISGRMAGFSAYSASKGGVHALTRAMAVSYGPGGIRVNCLVPGATRTAMTADIFADAETESRLARRSPLGRLGQPQDMAGVVVHLLSDETAWMTGATVMVDGGISIT